MKQVWCLISARNRQRKRSWHRRYSNVRLARGEPEHLVLPGPFGRQVGEASNAHTMRESALDRRFDEIGCEESQRDCHIDLSRAAVFTRGDGLRTCCWISDELIKPTTATGNRCHQSRSRLGAYRTRLFRPDPLGQKNLPASCCRCFPPRDLKCVWRLGKMDVQPVRLNINARDVSLDKNTASGSRPTLRSCRRLS